MTRKRRSQEVSGRERVLLSARTVVRISFLNLVFTLCHKDNWRVKVSKSFHTEAVQLVK
jgi:hypothetical protein